MSSSDRRSSGESPGATARSRAGAASPRAGGLRETRRPWCASRARPRRLPEAKSARGCERRCGDTRARIIEPVDGNANRAAVGDSRVRHECSDADGRSLVCEEAFESRQVVDVSELWEPLDVTDQRNVVDAVAVDRGGIDASVARLPLRERPDRSRRVRQRCSSNRSRNSVAAAPTASARRWFRTDPSFPERCASAALRCSTDARTDDSRSLRSVCRASPTTRP